MATEDFLGYAVRCAVSVGSCFFLGRAGSDIAFLAATCFPLIFISGPQLSPALAARASAAANTELTAVFNNGAITCRRLIWCTDAQPAWMREHFEPLVASARAKKFVAALWGGLQDAWAMQMSELFSAVVMVVLILGLHNGAINAGDFSGINVLLLSVVKPVKVPLSAAECR